MQSERAFDICGLVRILGVRGTQWSNEAILHFRLSIGEIIV